MTTTDLASRLSQMDWSACSLQHQLAIAATVETLKAMEAETRIDSPLVTFGAVSIKPEDVVAMSALTPDLSNVIAHPALKRTYRTVRILHLDGREWASAGFGGGSAGDAWAWIVETVAHELECAESDVGCCEGPEDEGGDYVTVDGVPVYKIGF